MLYNLYVNPMKVTKHDEELIMNRAGVLMPRTLPRRSYVKIVPIDPVEIDGITVNVENMTVVDLKTYLARVLRVQMGMITIIDPERESEVPDWTEPPDRLEAYASHPRLRSTS